MIREKRDIEWIITWALRDQGLGWTGNGRASDIGGELAMLGTRVDVSPSSGLPAPSMGLCDDLDALVVKTAIDRLDPDAQALVVLNGRIGRRPEWGEDGYGLPEQSRNKRGQLEWLYRDPKNWRGKIGPRLDWRAYEAHVAEVEFERAGWSVWHEALVVLAGELCGRLQRFEVVGPAAPKEPWAGLADKGPVEIPYRGSLAERRDLAGAPIDDKPTDSSVPLEPIERRRRRKCPQDRASGGSGKQRA